MKPIRFFLSTLIIPLLIAGCSYPQPTPFVFPTPMPTEMIESTDVVATSTEAATLEPTTAPATASPTVASTQEGIVIDFANSSYLVEGFDEPVQLVDGKHDNKEEQINLMLSDFTLQADLDADGDQDGAAILYLNTGGSGVFSMLSVLINEEGELSPQYPYVIDDRVKVTGFSAVEGVIQVDYLGREPDQPMSDEPGTTFIRYFSVSGEDIAEVDENGVDLVQSFAVVGSVTYKEKISLQPEAEVTIRLVDITKADSPAVLIEELTFPSDGDQVPFQFVVPYNPDEIDPEAMIAVNASISLEGKLLFTSTSIHPVITRGNPSTVEIILQKVN